MDDGVNGGMCGMESVCERGCIYRVSRREKELGDWMFEFSELN